MKKLVLVTLVSFLAFANAGCESKVEKYKNEKQTLNSLTQATVRFTKEVEATKNRIAIGRTITTFISEIRRMKPEMNQLEKICPDFKTTYGYKNAPKELQPALKKFSDALAYMKVVAEGKKSKFGSDKNVVKLFEEVKEILYYY